MTKMVNLVCCQCNRPFERDHGYNQSKVFCCVDCYYIHYSTTFATRCSQCNELITKNPKDLKKSKSGRLFCSISCGTRYNNLHKTHGTTRSKLEKWLEEQITLLYPNLKIHFNRKDTINSELDIFIPSLKLAFELNGIFHYEPIHGESKLEGIQNNDQRKFQACANKLCK
jgi:hypothetical protein